MIEICSTLKGQKSHQKTKFQSPGSDYYFYTGSLVIFRDNFGITRMSRVRFIVSLREIVLLSNINTVF